MGVAGYGGELSVSNTLCCCASHAVFRNACFSVLQDACVSETVQMQAFFVSSCRSCFGNAAEIKAHRLQDVVFPKRVLRALGWGDERQRRARLVARSKSTHKHADTSGDASCADVSEAVGCV